MKQLREMYEGFRGDYSQLENSPDYLAQLSIRAAIELDDRRLGRNNDFSHIKELSQILEKFQLQDTHDASNEPFFPYIPLWRAIEKNPANGVNTYPQLGVRMKLLQLELEQVPDYTPEKLEEITQFLCDLTQEFRYWESETNTTRYLVA